MVHPIKKIISEYKNGNHKGIFSVCSANKYVIEAAMERLRSSDMYLLIESTANQVDQFGGYTRMRPMDFKNFIKECCTCFNFPFERVILGGDHLGPLTWQKIDPEEAMENAKELIRQYVLAGFTKIHIDTSMKLFGDDVFGDEKIADRAGILCNVAEESFKELSLIDKDVLHPVYIIGSEVPIPGGAKSEEENSEGIQVTKVGGFKQTVETFKLAFENHGVKEAFDYVVGVVVQPGVEFSSDTVWEYDEDKAKDLSETIKSYSNLVYEAHSTDYQTKDKLHNMVKDGFVILKVGPALTFAFREAAFALNCIEEEIIPKDQKSNFKKVLDEAMVRNPINWINNYHGDEFELQFKRKYSYSDRCRYYMPVKEVNDAFEKMIENLSNVKIPLTIISQYMPCEYRLIRSKRLSSDPKALILNKIGECLDDYIFAVEG